MTIKEAIDGVNRLVPNQYDDSQKLAWLSELDRRIMREVIETHRHSEDIYFFGYDEDTDTESETLLVPTPHDDIYIPWLMAQIELYNQEYSRYNNAASVFNEKYSAYVNDYHASHLPITHGKIRW